MLNSKGLGQERIAKLMGVSQPMVSKYLRKSIGEIEAALEALGIDFNEATSVADALSSQLIRRDIHSYLTLFSSYINLVLSKGYLCNIHMKKYGAPPSCNICFNMFATTLDPIVEEVREAVNMFTSRPGVSQLVPSVGSNIVAAKPGAQGLIDVVGLTGAILRANHGVIVVGQPAYGGSKHTATIVLIAMKANPRKRAGIVIAYSDKCLATLREHGLNIVFTGPHQSPQDVYHDIQKELQKHRGVVDVIADKGGLGLEPVIYILGSSAGEAVSHALKCLD